MYLCNRVCHLCGETYRGSDQDDRTCPTCNRLRKEERELEKQAFVDEILSEPDPFARLAAEVFELRQQRESPPRKRDIWSNW